MPDDGPHQLRETGTGDGRDDEQGQPLRGAEPIDLLAVRSRVRQIRLVGDDDLGPRRQSRRVGGELPIDHVQIVDRIAARLRVEIEHVQQEARSLGVTQELVAEALALGGARNQPR